MKLVRACGASALFLLMLAGVYVVHARWLTVDVVFYAALGDALIACALATLLLVGLPWFRVLNGFEKAQLVVIWLLAGYAFAISVPTVIDRSLSIYLLEKIDQRGGGIRADRLAEVFVREYLPEHRLMTLRLTEQLASGTVVLDDGCVRLTDKGRRVVAFTRTFRAHLLPRQRLLLDHYSDALVDPFRGGVAAGDYHCGP